LFERKENPKNTSHWLNMQRPLSTLEYEGIEPRTSTVVVKQEGGRYGHHHHGGEGFFAGIGAFIMWFAILTIFIWLIIYSLRPGWVLNRGTNTVNTAVVLLASIIIALVIILILWLIKVGLGSSCGWM
jgi:hypothetical protein